MEETKYLRSIINGLQESIIIIDRNYHIIDVNDVTCLEFKMKRHEIINKYCYEITHHTSEPCFMNDVECPVKKVYETGLPVRVIHKHYLPDNTYRWEEITASPLKENGRIIHVVEEIRDPSELLKNKSIIDELKSEVQTLRGMLPICAKCKKIRNDQGYWENVEDYIQAHSGASFTHGLCPGCAKELYPSYYKGSKNK